MKICKHLNAENIFINASLQDKDAVLRFIADICADTGVVKNSTGLYDGLCEREQIMSTGIGRGIAFPHTTSAEASIPAVILIRPGKPVDFEALDNKPVDIILAIVVPEGQTAFHLQALAAASRLCKNSKFLTAVRKSKDAEGLWKQIKGIEEKMIFH